MLVSALTLALTLTAVSADRQRIEQILKNLLSNAFKFTNSGGKVTLNVSHPGPSIMSFSVSDTGIGIPKDKMQIIFEAFQQADGSTKRKYGGTGLGLSISRRYAIRSLISARPKKRMPPMIWYGMFSARRASSSTRDCACTR